MSTLPTLVGRPPGDFSTCQLLTEGGPNFFRAPAMAMALFDDGAAIKPRKPTAAEVRAKARRCKQCGGVVPAGMVDLPFVWPRSGNGNCRRSRRRPHADWAANRPQACRSVSPIVGGICFLSSIIAALVLLVLSAKGVSGAIYLGLGQLCSAFTPRSSSSAASR